MKKGRIIAACVAVHLIVSGMLLAGARVWQQCYDRTHRDPVAMASLTLSEDSAALTILGRRAVLPLTLTAPESPLWLALLTVTDAWTAGMVTAVSFIIEK